MKSRLATLRKASHSLELKIYSNLQQFSKISTSLEKASDIEFIQNRPSYAKAEKEIQSLLKDLNDTINEMKEQSKSDTNPSTIYIIKRYDSVLKDYNNEFQKIKKIEKQNYNFRKSAEKVISTKTNGQNVDFSSNKSNSANPEIKSPSGALPNDILSFKKRQNLKNFNNFDLNENKIENFNPKIENFGKKIENFNSKNNDFDQKFDDFNQKNVKNSEENDEKSLLLKESLLIENSVEKVGHVLETAIETGKMLSSQTKRLEEAQNGVAEINSNLNSVQRAIKRLKQHVGRTRFLLYFLAILAVFVFVMRKFF